MNRHFFLFEGKLALTDVITPDLITPTGKYIFENGLMDENYCDSNYFKKRIIPVRVKNIETGEIENIIEVSIKENPKHTDSETIKDFFNHATPEYKYSRGPLQDIIHGACPSGEKLVTYINHLKKLVITDIKKNLPVLEHTLIEPNYYHTTRMPVSKQDFFFKDNKLFFIAELYQKAFDKSRDHIKEKDLEHYVFIYSIDSEKNKLREKMLFKSKGPPDYGDIRRPCVLAKDKMIMALFDKNCKAFLNLIDINTFEINKINLENNVESCDFDSGLLTTVLSEDNNEIYVISYYDKYMISTINLTTNEIKSTEFKGPEAMGIGICYNSNGKIVAFLDIVRDGDTQMLFKDDKVYGGIMIYDLKTQKAEYSDFPDAVYHSEIRKIKFSTIQNIFTKSLPPARKLIEK